MDGVGPAPFLSKTYEMVDDPTTESIVWWGEAGNSFVVKKVPEFSKDLLPKYFKHNNFSSFVRQLNTYGFRKVDPDRWEFANEGFLRGQKHLLKIISRKKPSHIHNNAHHPPLQTQDKSVKSCVEVGNFGIEEEVERLKRDKNVLMQELVRLRQQQQTTDHQLQTVGQRVQVMEQRQQQMMAFLAKAMQSPGFMNQLVQQQNESNNRRIDGVNKKRRLPEREEGSGNSTAKRGVVSPNGQMVKYQPLMNEAAKTMMGHIMKMNVSSRLEPTMNGGGFLFNNMQSFADNSSSQTSLSKTLSISSHPYLSTEPEVPNTFPSAAECESYPPVNLTPQKDAFVSDISPLQGLLSESSSQVLGSDIHLSETGNAGLITNDFNSDPSVDNVVLDEIPELPGINDIFWEQFLSVGQLVGESDEIDSESLESCISTELDWQKGQESGWDNLQEMTHLTEQMGLLAQRPQGYKPMFICPCSLGKFKEYIFMLRYLCCSNAKRGRAVSLHFFMKPVLVILIQKKKEKKRVYFVTCFDGFNVLCALEEVDTASNF